MGFFDTWNVSGITTDASKSSEPFYLLAEAIDSDSEFDIPVNILLGAASHFVQLKNNFDLFFNSGVKSHKTDAVKFLVIFAAYGMGKDCTGWQWQAVRHLSQGLYTSMKDSPAHFLHFNTPLIETASSEVIRFIEKNR